MKFYTNVERIGNSIRAVGYDNGARFDSRASDFMPVMYETTTSNNATHRGLKGEPLRAIAFDDIRSCEEKIKECREIANKPELHGHDNYVMQYILQEYGQKIDFDRSLINVQYLDIEVASDQGFPEPRQALYPVISIAMVDGRDGSVNVWGLEDYNPKATELTDVDPSKINYIKCNSEMHLLTQWATFWRKCDIDVVSGWYIQMFDIPYLVNRINRVFGEGAANKLSRWNKVRERNIKILNKEEQTFNILGVQQLDYMDLFRKFGYIFGPQESYRLDHIAYVILGENKLSYEEYGNLHTLYKRDHQKFIDYNIKDSYLVHKLDKNLDFISLACMIAYTAGTNYIDSFGTVGVWNSMIYRALADMDIVPPPFHQKDATAYEGGYVKDPQVGAHKWVCSFDLNSLYPNIIIQYNMSPETITDKISDVNVDILLKDPANRGTSDTSMAAHGVHFSNEHVGILPRLIDQLYKQRVDVKARMIELSKQNEKNPSSQLKGEISRLGNQQMTIKILLNSLYGATANPWFRYFDSRIADSITSTGRLTIRTAEKAINKYLNDTLKTDKDYVIAIDTDSIYINLEDLVTKVFGEDQSNIDKIIKFLDNVCTQKLEPLLEQTYNTLSRGMGCVENRMVMAREAIADKGIWTAKKRYILNVYNNEGVQYAEPKLKVMGIEAVKSSTPEVVRNKLKEAFKIVVQGEEKDLHDFIAEFKDEFYKLPPESVAFPRSVSSVKTLSNAEIRNGPILEKGTPIHVRGAILYNYMVKKNEIDKQYPIINNGEKIKFTYMTLPNPLRQNVFAFQDYLPRELDLAQYVDYNTQFNKSFIEPLSVILGSIGWTAEPVSTLESFFG